MNVLKNVQNAAKHSMPVEAARRLTAFASPCPNDWNNNLWVWYRVQWQDGLTGWSAQNWLREPPDTTPPAVLASQFVYATRPHRITFAFSESVQSSLSVDDLIVEDLTHGGTVSGFAVGYDSATNNAAFTYTAGVLPEGRYRATLPADRVADAAGNPLAGDHVITFTFLRGDADNDGVVNLADFNTLAANFGQSPRDFTQGDFDYTGMVDLADFNVLVGRFGASVAPAATIPRTFLNERGNNFDEEFDLFGNLRIA